MLLFIFGLGFPRMLGLEVNIWFAAGGALILYASAYIGEVWRGAIESVSQNQWEAGRAVGLNFFSKDRLIVFPQALQNFYRANCWFHGSNYQRDISCLHNWFQ